MLSLNESDMSIVPVQATVGEHVCAAAIKQLMSLVVQLIGFVLFSIVVVGVVACAELVETVDVKSIGAAPEDGDVFCMAIVFSAAICGR